MKLHRKLSPRLAFKNKTCFLSGDMKKLPADCRTNGCGKGANCQLKDGGYTCQCPPGTTGSPQKECNPGKCFFLNFFRENSFLDSTQLVS